jgi:hypothetical protein
MLIERLDISYDEAQYNEYLAKVERVKLEMGEKYLLHPSNHTTKKDDNSGDPYLRVHHRRDHKALEGLK